MSAHTTRRTTQVVTVKHTRGWHARVTYWTRDPGGPWEARRQVTDGRTGYGGLVRGGRTGARAPAPRRSARSGCRRSSAPTSSRTRGGCPTGGSGPATYWVQDNASDYYNRYRNKAQGGFRWWLPSSHADSSERLTGLPPALRVRRRHVLQPRAGAAPRGRHLPARQRPRRDGRLCERSPMAAAVPGPRPRPGAPAGRGDRSVTRAPRGPTLAEGREPTMSDSTQTTSPTRSRKSSAPPASSRSWSASRSPSSVPSRT